MDQEGTTAIEGKHYEVEFGYGCGAGRGEARRMSGYVFSGRDDMMEKAIRLALRLEENEYFKCYFPGVQEHECLLGHGSADSRGRRSAFSLSEMYTAPSYWKVGIGGDYFGNVDSSKST